MNKAQLIRLGLAAAIISAGLTHIATVIAQKAERGTMQWNVPINDWGGNNALHIVDTSGVCIYIVSWGNDGSPAIAAVPKGQLPVGAGCQ